MFLMTFCSLGHAGEYGLWYNGPDSTGQIGVKFNVRYSGKTVKYCKIVCSPINAVEDFVACAITGKVEAEITITGPINSGYHEWTYDGWYNSNITNVIIDRVVLLYMDGSSESIPGKKVVEDMHRWQQLKQQEQQLKAQQRSERIKTILGTVFGIIAGLIVLIRIIAFLIDYRGY